MIISIDKYKKTGGGGDAKPTEELKQTITENGTQTFNPKEGYVFSSASITTNIHPTETLIATITENGSHSFDGEYNRAQINVDVKQNESDLGYFETSEFGKIKSYINSNGYISDDMHYLSQIGVYNEPLFLLKNRIPLMQYSYNNQSWEYVYDCNGNQLYTNRCPDWYLDAIKTHDSSLFDNVFGNALSDLTREYYGETLTEDVPYIDSSFNIQYHSTILLPENSLYNDNISYNYSMSYVDFPTVPNDAYSIDYQNDIIIGKAPAAMWINNSTEMYSYNIDDYIKSYLDKTGGYVDYALINLWGNPDDNGRYYFPLTVPNSKHDNYYYLNGVNKCCVFYLEGENQKVYDDLKFYVSIDNNSYNINNPIPINGVKYSLLFDATEYTRSNNRANITGSFFKTGLYEFIVKTSEQSTLIIDYGDYMINRLVLEGVPSTAKPIGMIISGFSGREIVCNYEGNIINCGTDASNFFSSCSNLTSIPKLDTSNVTNMSSMFSNCKALTSIPELDTSNVTTMDYIFYECTSLTSIPELDASNVTNMDSPFGYNALNKLTDLGGFKNLSVSINYFLERCPNLTVESLMNVINNLATVSGKSLSFGSTNLNKLTADQIAIATAKGWTLTA